MFPCLLFAAPSLRAHEPGKSFLSFIVTSNGITGRWDIPLRDLRAIMPLKLDRDGFVSFDELTARYPAISAYATSRLKITIDGHPSLLRLKSGETGVEEFADGVYVELPFTLENSSGAKTLAINYQLFFETNSLHRGYLRLENGGRTQTTIFSPDHPTRQFDLGAAAPDGQFLVFLREGVFHIWTGYDHILFLLALLLPSVLRRGTDQCRNGPGASGYGVPPSGGRVRTSNAIYGALNVPGNGLAPPAEAGTPYPETNASGAGHWTAAPNLRGALGYIIKIVTAFTVAHSITLSLAACRVVSLPSRLTESAIAVSVILAAANNLWPVVRDRGWIVAFGFGLVHGFGFANALSELGLQNGALALRLVGFNLGVEAGQLAIVAFFVPLAFALRRTKFYQLWLLQAGSTAVILIATVWLLERIFDFKLLPF